MCDGRPQLGAGEEPRMITFKGKNLLAAITRRLQDAQRRLTAHQFDLPIAQCVHYGAFRFGCKEYNPYESYLNDIQQRVPLKVARRRFIEFLMYYRPRHLGDALGIRNLSREYPLLTFPWDAGGIDERCGWCATADLCPDLLTHFCLEGVSSFRIEEEFVWLERALDSMMQDGYQPEQHTFANTLQLCSRNGLSAYIVLNGNHRVAALSALGHKRVRVLQKLKHCIHELDVERWPRVRTGIFYREDALRVFQAFFEGNHNYRTSSTPASIIAHKAWTKLYLL
jgi:hypothetical protein